MSPNHRHADDMVLDALHSMRTLAGMEVAFISQFKDEGRIFRCVDPLASDVPIRVGSSDPLEDSYCQRVIDGPELIQAAMELAEARKLPATAAVPVGAHLSVPIRLSDGGIYGTFCCKPTTGPGLIPYEASRLARQPIRRKIEIAHLASSAVDDFLCRDGAHIWSHCARHIARQFRGQTLDLAQCHVFE